MQRKPLALLALLCAAASCAPEEKCSGDLVYNEQEAVCYACPKDATYKDGTCECKAGYAYQMHRCVLIDGGVPGVEDAGAPQDSAGGPSCPDYCTFSNECIGQNPLASSVLSDIVSGLHADDPAACRSSCQTTLGNQESGNAVISCIVAGKEGAMCKDPNPQNSLMGAFGLMGECCGTRQSDPLCKSICAALKANALVASMVPFCP